MLISSLERGFIGRDRELDALVAALNDVERTGGRLFLIGGEAGIGKSRLAEEFAARAKAEGCEVLWGRSWEAGGAPAYWPWVQSLRSYLSGRDLRSIRQELPDIARDLGDLLPELREERSDVGPDVGLDSEAARFRLFESITGFLRAIASEAPVVLVLDDLHSADESSLLLLRFLSQSMTGTRLLVLGMFRTETDTTELFGPAVAELLRSTSTTRIDLRGLDIGELAAFIELHGVSDATSPVATALFERSEGNPLFLHELVRLLAAEGRFTAGDEIATSLPIPHTLTDIIEKRFEYMSEGVIEVLEVAAILGREFDLDLLSRVSKVPLDSLLSLLEDARIARLVVEAPTTPGRWRFSHVLIRDVLYERQPVSDRLHVHEVAAVTLSSIHGSDLSPHVTAIAHHYFEAIPVSDPRRAVEYGELAGDRASELLAYEEAARLYGLALGALDVADSPSDAERCELLLKLGDARAKAGVAAKARATFLDAAAVARRARLPEHLARAALGYGGRFVWWFARGDTRFQPLLEEAIEMLDPGDSVVRVKLMARLAAGPLRATLDPRRFELSSEALAMAGRLDDPTAITYALRGRFEALLAADHHAERLPLATRLLEVSEEIGDAEGALQGHVYLFHCAVEAGDIERARDELTIQIDLAERLRQPSYRWEAASCAAMMALLQGNFRVAEDLIPGALEMGRHVETWNSELAYRLQLYLLRREQGRLGEVEHMVDGEFEGAGTPWGWHAVRAHFYKETDRTSLAQRELDRLSEDGFERMAPDEEWLTQMIFTCEVAAHLKDLGKAATLYEFLLPFSGLNAYATSEICLGAAARGLGVLATVLGRFDDAAGHFARALELNIEMGASPWIARTHLDSARMLRARDLPGDREVAESHVQDALSIARKHGMVALEAELTSIGSSGVRSPAPPVHRPESLFKREGEYWTIEYEGGISRLKDSKGLGHLATLLSSPDREFHALDLARAGLPIPDPPGRGRKEPDLVPTADQGDAGAILDPTAKAAYKRRLDEIDAEIQEADDWGDLGRAARAREERGYLVAELSSAVGLGGRDRKAASSAERARVSVTRAVRSAIDRLRESNAPLADHLAATVKTGTFCSYRPDPRAAVTWRITS